MKKTKFKKHEIIELFWIDSMSDGGWRPESKALELTIDIAMKHMSVGYYLGDTPQSYIIAQSKSDYDDQFNVAEILQIPKAAVSKIKRYK